MKPNTEPKAHLVIGYIRTSNAKHEISPRAQREEIEGWCCVRGKTLCEVFEDQLSGGTPIERRPGLVSALEAIPAYRASGLVVLKRDRIARDVISAAMIERLAAKHGAKIYTVDGVGNGDGPEDELLRTIVDAFAQYERALGSMRAKITRQHMRSRNEWCGTAPYGFRFGEDQRALIPDEGEQEIIERILRARDLGMSRRDIVASLNAQGIVARGARWHLSSVSRIITRAEGEESARAAVEEDPDEASQLRI